MSEIGKTNIKLQRFTLVQTISTYNPSLAHLLRWFLMVEGTNLALRLKVQESRKEVKFCKIIYDTSIKAEVK